MYFVQANVPVPDPPLIWPRSRVGWGQGGSPKSFLEFGLSLPLSEGQNKEFDPGLSCPVTMSSRPLSYIVFVCVFLNQKIM